MKLSRVNFALANYIGGFSKPPFPFGWLGKLLYPNLKVSLRLLISAFIIAGVGTVGTARADCVVLLHGLARGKTSMKIMEAALASAGFETVNQGYPSRSLAFSELVSVALDDAAHGCGDQRTHFVTHSMGGI
ncbi:MAG: esterase/lipase family protein, partial [Boseongicola sp.]